MFCATDRPRGNDNGGLAAKRKTCLRTEEQILGWGGGMREAASSGGTALRALKKAHEDDCDHGRQNPSRKARLKKSKKNHGYRERGK